MRSAWGLDIREKDLSWNDAACKDLPPSWWELTYRSGPNPHRLGYHNRQAQEICVTCPIRQRCYDMAVDTGVAGHIFGGVALWRSAARPDRVCASRQCRRSFHPTNVRQRFCTEQCRTVENSLRRSG